MRCNSEILQQRELIITNLQQELKNFWLDCNIIKQESKYVSEQMPWGNQQLQPTTEIAWNYKSSTRTPELSTWWLKVLVEVVTGSLFLYVGGESIKMKCFFEFDWQKGRQQYTFMFLPSINNGGGNTDPVNSTMQHTVYYFTTLETE